MKIPLVLVHIFCLRIYSATRCAVRFQQDEFSFFISDYYLIIVVLIEN